MTPPDWKIPMKNKNLGTNIVNLSNSNFYAYFEEIPLGFIDIGAAGGIYPPILSVAPFVHSICFEPNKEEADRLRAKYESDNPFAKLSVIENAVGSSSEMRKLYVTKSSVNSSFLMPRDKIITRYNIPGLRVEKEILTQTTSIDELFFDHYQKTNDSFGEFIKVDCQGVEHEILEGAEKVLKKFCVTIVCEINFFQVYHSQKSFFEIDLFLKKLGFQLYAIYPKYISAKNLDRKKFDTEERLVTGDAIYFKDPLDIENYKSDFTERNIRALILSTIITQFYDFAIDLISIFINDKKEKELLINDVKQLGLNKKTLFEFNASKYLEKIRNNPDLVYLLSKKFIDKHSNNSSIDFINLKT